MAISFPRFPWSWMRRGDKEQVPNGAMINPKNSLGESLKLYSMSGGDRRVPSSSSTSNRKSKRKWKSREERSRRIDKEYDVVLVPSDGVGLSGSESDDSDWSIGWLEPHAPGFQSDDDLHNSFAVLVPCYRDDNCQAVEDPTIQFFTAANNHSAGNNSKEYMEQWLSSLQNF